MSAQALLDDLQARGVRISANGDRLRIIAPPGTVTPELREQLAANKPQLIDALLQREALTYLEQNHTAKYGIATQPGPDAVMVAVAIREAAVCTLRIPADRWNEFTFMRLLNEEHTA